MLNKKIVIILSMFTISFFVIPNSIVSVNAHNPTWWNYDWDRRLELTVNSSLIDETLINFPVLVYIDEDLVNWGDIQNNLDDIRFIDDYLTELDFEIDDYTLNDEAWFWVRIPIVTSAEDTYFFMYYDNKFAVSGENAESVWDNGFLGVWHMNDGNTTAVFDSSVNGNDFIKRLDMPFESDYAQIGNSQGLTAANDIMNRTYFLFPNEFYTSFWFNTNSTNPIITMWTDGTTGGFGTWTDDQWYFGNFADWSNVPIGLQTDDTWNCYSVTWDDSSDNLTSYRNGVYLGSTVLDNIDGENGGIDGLCISSDNRNPMPNLPTQGYFDEFRIGDITRSAIWVKASFYSETLGLIIFGLHEHVTDITLREDIDDATLLILIAFVILCSAFTIIITQKWRK